MRLKFEATYMHRRIRREDPVAFTETFSIEIPELEADAAPVVAVAGGIPWRRSDDGFLKRVGDGGRNAVAMHVVGSIRSHGSDVRRFVLVDEDAPDVVPVLPTRSCENGRDTVLSALAAARRDLVVADGDLLVRDREPGLKLTADADGGRAVGSRCLVSISSNRPDLPLSAASALAAYLAPEEAGAVPETLVFVPEAFAPEGPAKDAFFEDEMRRLMRSAKWSVASFDEDGMSAWADMRDVLAPRRRREGIASALGLEEVVGAARRVVGHLPEGRDREGLEAICAWWAASGPDRSPGDESADDLDLEDWGRTFG